MRFSSRSTSFFISSPETFTSADPPPATIPSSIAAFVAFTASSILSLRYFISVSVAAPTRITATPPDSFAIRSSSFSLSNFESVFSRCPRSAFTRASISNFFPFPPTITVLSFVATTRDARPSISISAFSSFTPISSETTCPPTVIAISCRISFFLSPYPGAFTASTENPPRNLLTTNVASASPSTSSAIITNSFLPVCANFSRSGRIA